MLCDEDPEWIDDPEDIEADGIEADDYDDYYDDHNEEPYCHRCDNTGWIVTCIDDLCHSGPPGESCIHGDGDELCPDCKGRNAF